MNIKLSVFSTFALLLLLLSATTVVVTIISIIPDHKVMAQVTGTTTTNSTTSNATITNPLSLTYTNSTAGIKIQYPSNWQPQRPDNPSVTVRFISPVGGVLGIQASDIPPDITLAEETAAGINMLKKIFDNFNLTDSTPIIIAGNNPAQRIEYTARQDQLDLGFIQVITIKDGKEYILTFGVPKDQFQSDVQAVQQMVNSFQIINNTSQPVGAAAAKSSLSPLLSSPSTSSSAMSVEQFANTIFPQLMQMIQSFKILDPIAVQSTKIVFNLI